MTMMTISDTTNAAAGLPDGEDPLPVRVHGYGHPAPHGPHLDPGRRLHRSVLHTRYYRYRYRCYVYRSVLHRVRHGQGPGGVRQDHQPLEHSSCLILIAHTLIDNIVHLNKTERQCKMNE